MTADGVTYSTSHNPGAANSAWVKYIDGDGELVTPLQGNVTQVTRYYFQEPPDGIPADFNRVGEKWILKWDGVVSDVKIGYSTFSTLRGNRIDWTWKSNTGNSSRGVFGN